MAAEIARPVTVIADWNGMLENADPIDFPPGGADEQVNVSSHKYGELNVRRGLVEVTFETT